MRATDIIWKNFIHYDKMHKYFLLKNDEMKKNLIHDTMMKCFMLQVAEGGIRRQGFD